MDGGLSQKRVRGPPRQFHPIGLDRGQNAAHMGNGIDPLARPASVSRNAVSGHVGPRKALVSDHDVELARLENDGHIRPDTPLQKRLRACRVSLLVSNASDNYIAPGRFFRKRDGGGQHRRQASFNILRTAAVQTALLVYLP